MEKTSSELPKDRRRYTYSPDWQLLEEEVTDVTGKYRYEYIWGIRGLDDLVCRERYDADNKLQQRYFALPDANGNVVAVVDTVSGSGRLIQYDPYGQPTNAGDFHHLFGGYYYDQRTGLYLVRNRVYHPHLGRWLQQDPLGFVDGTNLYEYVGSNPANFVDPSGQELFTTFVVGVALVAAALAFTSGVYQGEPEELEGLVPVWGAARYAGAYLAQGESSAAALYSGLAIADVFFIKALFTTLGRVAFTGGASVVGRKVAVETSEAALREFAKQEIRSTSFGVKLLGQNVSRWIRSRVFGGQFQWVTRSHVLNALETTEFVLGAKSRIDPLVIGGYRLQSFLGGKWVPRWMAREAMHHELLHLTQFVRSPALHASELAARSLRLSITRPMILSQRAFTILRHEAYPWLVGSPSVTPSLIGGMHIAYQQSAYWAFGQRQ